jgi:hypothetical protein
MSTPPPTDRAALGRARLAARARRLSLIRRRVVAATLATLALAWGVIAFAGPMGEPAESTTAASTQAPQTTTTTTGETSGSSGSGSSDASASSGSALSDDSSSQSTTPMTTAQS